MILDYVPGDLVTYKIGRSVISLPFHTSHTVLCITHVHLAADIRGETLVVEGGLHF